MPDRALDPDVKNLLLRLKTHDFQLAFLALLTLEEVKPLSRWEKPLPDGMPEALKELGLSIRRVRRTTSSGREIFETLFSMDTARPEEYAARFDGCAVDKNPDTQRLEGRLFGYPSCCVEAFIERPYTDNGLVREDQAILFHWACPGCKATPYLLVRYRALHALLEAL